MVETTLEIIREHFKKCHADRNRKLETVQTVFELTREKFQKGESERNPKLAGKREKYTDNEQPTCKK